MYTMIAKEPLPEAFSRANIVEVFNEEKNFTHIEAVKPEVNKILRNLQPVENFTLLLRELLTL